MVAVIDHEYNANEWTRRLFEVEKFINFTKIQHLDAIKITIDALNEFYTKRKLEESTCTNSQKTEIDDSTSTLNNKLKELLKAPKLKRKKLMGFNSTSIDFD